MMQNAGSTKKGNAFCQFGCIYFGLLKVNAPKVPKHQKSISLIGKIPI